MPRFINDLVLLGLRKKLLSAVVNLTGISVVIFHQDYTSESFYGDKSVEEQEGYATTMRFVPQQVRRALPQFNAFFEDVLPFIAYFDPEVPVRLGDRIVVQMASVGSDAALVTALSANNWQVIEVYQQDSTQQYFGAQKVSLAPWRAAVPATPTEE